MSEYCRIKHFRNLEEFVLRNTFYLILYIHVPAVSRAGYFSHGSYQFVRKKIFIFTYVWGLIFMERHKNLRFYQKCICFNH